MPTLDLGRVRGNDGVGVPTGGNTGQILTKASNANHDTKWVDIPKVEVDSTLKVSGKAADAKATGDALGRLSKQIVDYRTAVNLLDNSDFRNPVNQRGQTSYSNLGYSIDRWRAYHTDTTHEIVNGGIKVTSSGNNPNIYQQIDTNLLKAGTTYTAAACDNSGNIYIWTGTKENTQASSPICVYISGSNLLLRLTRDNTTWVWAALYEGKYTAETLPPYAPKGYATELAACNTAPVNLGGGYGGGSLQAYPVGSIYMSLESTSPASLFGGTWERIIERFLFGGTSSTYPIGRIGGATTANLAVTGFAHMYASTNGDVYLERNVTDAYTATHKISVTSVTAETKEAVTAAVRVKGTASGNIMPPYLAVYMWKRVS